MLASKDNSRPSTTSESSQKQKEKKEVVMVDYQDPTQKMRRQKDLERLGLFSDIGYLQPNVYVPKDKGRYLYIYLTNMSI
jgi:hypothetical protein